MIVVLEGVERASHQRLFDTMFEDRKKLFVDLLGWNVSVIADRFEIDAYDGDDALYLIALDGDERHAGSMRLLPTHRPHILGELFPCLCDEPVPADPSTFEITRLCLPARYDARQRLATRNALISAMVDYALANGIDRLTGVVEASFRAKILAMGWRCRPLGPARKMAGAKLGAFEIIVKADTPALLVPNGIYSPGSSEPRSGKRIAA